MCATSTGMNQTHDDVHKYFSEQRRTIATFNHHAELGTGIFGVPDPEAGIMEAKKILVKDLTYKETVKRGQHCLAFAFVPKGMLSFEQLTALSCSENCTSTTPCPTAGCVCGGFGCL